MRLTRRGVQLTLGVIWLLDAGLQTQPFMFTRAFADQVVSSAGDNQPVFVAGPVHTVAGWIAIHPALWDGGVIALQALIGLGLLTRRFARPALAASALWAASVWWLGEGLGGIGNGGANLLTGAPGPALLYAALALAAWPSRAGGTPYARRRPVAAEAPARWIVAVWALVWLLGAALQLLPDQRSAPDLAALVSSGGNAAPGWLYRLDFTLARLIGHGPDAVVIGLAAVEALIGLIALARLLPLGVLHRLWTPSCWLGIVIALAFWFVGQGLGGFTAGQATDPGTGPLLALAGVAALAAVGGRRDFGYSRGGSPAATRHRRAAWA